MQRVSRQENWNKKDRKHNETAVDSQMHTWEGGKLKSHVAYLAQER